MENEPVTVERIALSAQPLPSRAEPGKACGSVGRMTQPLSVAVIVPVYNSAAKLEQCLTALMTSTLKGIDVLVVDDGSTEPIQPLVERFGFRYLRIDRPGGPGRARNRGVQNTTAHIVIFVDADVCIHADTMERFVKAFEQDGELAAVFGSYDDDPTERGLLSQYRNLLHHYTHCRSAGPIPSFWAGCGAIRREIFLEYGGFDEERYRRPAIEDIELGTWMAADGRRIILDPSAQCKHLKRWTFGSIIRTDILQRGIPWIDLIQRSRKAVRTLNINRSQQLSVALVAIAGLLALLSVWRPQWLFGVAAAALAVTLLNLDFYRYLASKRGLLFAVRSAPLHWLYFVCCGVSVVLGRLQHCRQAAGCCAMRDRVTTRSAASQRER